MRHTASAHIGNLIHLRLTGITGRRYDLHKRRLIIFLVNVAGLKTCGNMYGCIFRPKRHSHGKADSLTGHCSFPVNTFPVCCPLLYNMIRNGLNISHQGLRFRFKTHTGNLFKYFVTDSFYICIQTSHCILPFLHFF